MLFKPGASSLRESKALVVNELGAHIAALIWLSSSLSSIFGLLFATVHCGSGWGFHWGRIQTEEDRLFLLAALGMTSIWLAASFIDSIFLLSLFAQTFLRQHHWERKSILTASLTWKRILGVTWVCWMHRLHHFSLFWIWRTRP